MKPINQFRFYQIPHIKIQFIFTSLVYFFKVLFFRFFLKSDFFNFSVFLTHYIRPEDKILWLKLKDDEEMFTTFLKFENDEFLNKLSFKKNKVINLTSELLLLNTFKNPRRLFSKNFLSKKFQNNSNVIKNYSSIQINTDLYRSSIIFLDIFSSINEFYDLKYLSQICCMNDVEIIIIRKKIKLISEIILLLDHFKKLGFFPYIYQPLNRILKFFNQDTLKNEFYILVRDYNQTKKRIITSDKIKIGGFIY